MTGGAWTIDDLLNDAGVARENRDAARRWLEGVLDRARAAAVPPKSGTPLGYGLARALNPDLAPRDDDKLLGDLAKSAETLLAKLRELRSRPYQHTVFWSAVVFGASDGGRLMRRLDAALPMETPTGLENDDVIRALHGIVIAAEGAKQKRAAHRPKGQYKQALVDDAALFWSILSPHPLTGEKEGKFRAFAEAFHEVATGKRESVERAVRAAVKRVAPREQNYSVFP